MMRNWLVLLVGGVSFLPPAVACQNEPGHDRSVGAITRSFVPDGPYNWRGAKMQQLRVTIWYPVGSETSMSEQTIGAPESPLFRLGRWEENAQIAAGQFPLIALSHGTGGSARIMAWLARGLAARGYIVAGVDHPGNNALEAYTPEGFLIWWERARDLSATIDMLLDDSDFAPAIDLNRIGAIGFSLGGYTVIELAGSRTDPKRLRDFCQSPAGDACVDPPEFPGLFAQWEQLERSDQAFRVAAAEAGRSLREPRIRAVVAIAPALGPALVPESLRQITIPVEIIAGRADLIVPVSSNAEWIASLIPRANLTLFPDVGHYTFLATCTDVGRLAQPQLCADVNGLDRETIHRQTIERAGKFFDETLR